MLKNGQDQEMCLVTFWNVTMDSLNAITHQIQNPEKPCHELSQSLPPVVVIPANNSELEKSKEIATNVINELSDELQKSSEIIRMLKQRVQEQQQQILLLKQLVNIPSAAFTEEPIPVGKGSFAIVKKATWNNPIIAVKQFTVPLIDEAEFNKEFNNLVALQCDQLVKVHGFCIENQTYKILLEYMNKGSLYKMLHNENTKLGNSTILKFAKDILVGLEYIHGKSMMHRDLKTSNILVAEANDTIVCKIADLGLARVLPQSSDVPTLAGTPLYMAPEQVSGQMFTNSVDLYAFAVIVYEMLTNEYPIISKQEKTACIEKPMYAYHTMMKYFESVGESQSCFAAPMGAPASLTKIIAICSSKNPANRQSASQLLQLL